MSWDLLFPSLSLVVGWGAGQLWPVAKNYIYRDWLKKNIVVELSQINEELSRIRLAYARALQLYARGKVGEGVSLPISTAIYSNHYKDAVFVFNPTQRIALQMFYSYVDAVNRNLTSLRTFWDDRWDLVFERKLSEKDLEWWGIHIREGLETVGRAQWQAGYYLEHPIFPALEFQSEAHKQFVKHCDELREWMAKVESAARAWPTDDGPLLTPDKDPSASDGEPE